jgi:Xaa-Pro aminopeptidase
MGLIGRLAAFALVCLAAAAAAERPVIPLEEYRQRRFALRTSVGDNLVVLFGHNERDGGEIRSGFYQEPNFYYLTGWAEPGAALVITPKSEVLLLPRRDKTQEHWTGRKAAPEDPNIESSTGFDTVAPVETLEQSLTKWLSEGRHIYTLSDLPRTEVLRKLAPMREIRNVAEIVARMRMKKSPAELGAIQYATDAAVDAHLASWKRVAPGVSEYQLANVLSSTYFDRGCERHAYAPIAGSGPNSTVLHYSKNSRRMDAGDLLLVDAGPECGMYTADITRTVPVSGKWTKRQREIYEVVLGAHQAAIAAIKPGVLFGSRTNRAGLQKLVFEYFEAHGGLGKYFTHGLGHHVGLEVHDAHDPARPLEAGMVITIEPGLYLPEEGIGVRIEDMVLVTENGARVLSERLPRDPAAIERILSSR